MLTDSNDSTDSKIGDILMARTLTALYSVCTDQTNDNNQSVSQCSHSVDSMGLSMGISMGLKGSLIGLNGE